MCSFFDLVSLGCLNPNALKFVYVEFPHFSGHYSRINDNHSGLAERNATQRENENNNWKPVLLSGYYMLGKSGLTSDSLNDARRNLYSDRYENCPDFRGAFIFHSYTTKYHTSFNW